MELETFLVIAKKSTSGSEETEPVQLDDGSKEYRFESEDYVFRDRFFGGNPFVGEEIVYWKGDPLDFVSNMNRLIVLCRLSIRQMS